MLILRQEDSFNANVGLLLYAKQMFFKQKLVSVALIFMFDIGI